MWWTQWEQFNRLRASFSRLINMTYKYSFKIEFHMSKFICGRPTGGQPRSFKSRVKWCLECAPFEVLHLLVSTLLKTDHWKFSVRCSPVTVWSYAMSPSPLFSLNNSYGICVCSSLFSMAWSFFFNFWGGLSNQVTLCFGFKPQPGRSCDFIYWLRDVK